jgi:hypothetical protein
MGKVITEASMSLDGYIAKQDNTIGRLFDWLQNGDVEIATPAKDFAVHLTPRSAKHWRRWISARRTGSRENPVRLRRRLEWTTHVGRAGGGRDTPGAHRLDSRPSRRPVLIRDRWVEAAVEHAQQIAGDTGRARIPSSKRTIP